MNEESPALRPIPARAPQPITINGNTYEFDPVSGSFTARLADFTAKETERIRRLARQVRSPRIRVRAESTPRGRWQAGWVAFDEMVNNKSEDWYIPGGKESA